MKVLFLTSSYSPVIGGAESYAAMLAEGLTARGVGVLVVTDSPYVDAPRFPAARRVSSGVEICRLSSYLSLLTNPDKIRWEQMIFSLLVELEDVIKEFRPDLVHANSLETAFVGAIAARARKLPIVSTMHEQEPELEALGEGKCRLVYGDIGLDAVICGSKFYEARAIRFGDPSKTHLIYHGIDTEKFSPTGKNLRSRLGVSSTARLVTCAARLKPRKGILEFVEAMPRIREQVPNACFVIAGTSSSGSTEYATLVERRISELGLSTYVSLIREATFDMMPAIYRASDAVVVPSLAEGLGLTVLEAMACGVPLVATQIPGIVEIFDGFSLPHELVPAGDSEQLAMRTAELLVDPAKAARLSATGTAHISKNFSYSSMLERTLKVYHQVLQNCDVNRA